MRSSTSSSSDVATRLREARTPAGPWGRTWLLALVLAAAALGSLEAVWRHRGHVPTQLDDNALWALRRAEVPDGGRDTVALLGSSRVRLGFSMDEFRRAFPGCDAVQLGLDGLAPVAALRDLADDGDFAGVVVCSVTAEGLRAAVREDQAGLVRLYRTAWGFERSLNRTIASAVQDHLTVVSPDLSLVRILQCLATTHALPEPSYLVTRPDRSRLADYTRLDVARHRAERVRRAAARLGAMEPPAPDAWLAQALEGVEPAVAAIRARGGKVVFVRFPTTGEHLAFEESRFPKALYWDRFSAATRATTIHFADVPSLRGFECPDCSHLDRRDAPRFTRALCRELVARGVLHGPPGAGLRPPPVQAVPAVESAADPGCPDPDAR